MRRKRAPVGQVNLQKKDRVGSRLLYETKGRQKMRLNRYIEEEIS